MNNEELFINAHTLPKALNTEAINELLEKVKQGDTRAREKVIEHNIRLVLYQVNGFKNVEYDPKELVSIGNIGLVKAVDSFDTSKNIKFATYASRCINNEILMFLRKVRQNQLVDSMDKIIYDNKDGKEISLKEMIPSDENIEGTFTDIDSYKEIRKTVDELPKRDKEIIQLHFGFNDDRIYTQNEIAQKFNISQSYVSRLIERIVEQLAIKLKSQGIIENHKKLTKVKKDEIFNYFKGYKEQEILDVINTLPEENKKIIELRYGLNGNTAITYREVAEQLGIKPSTLSTRIISIRRTIKNRLDKNLNKELIKTIKSETNTNTIKIKTTDETAKDVQVHEKVEVKLEAPVVKVEEEKNIDIKTRNTKENLTIESNNNEQNQRCIKVEVKDEEVTLITNKNQVVTPINESYQNHITSLVNLYDDTTEQIVLLLNLGCVRNRHYTEQQISEFLNIDIKEVNGIVSNFKDQLKILINRINDTTAKTVLLLNLGYVRGQYYSEEQISNFLNISQNEINEIINNGLSNVVETTLLSLEGNKKILNSKYI